MNKTTPTEVVRSLLWILEVQAHINDCCATEHDDFECIRMASVLQTRVDREWDRLGLLKRRCPRPFSALRDQQSASVDERAPISNPSLNTSSHSAANNASARPRMVDKRVSVLLVGLDQGVANAFEFVRRILLMPLTTTHTADQGKRFRRY